MSITIKKLDPRKNIDKNYLRWMNDFEVHKYTEQKYKKHTIQSIRKFVKEKNKSKTEFLYGIFFQKKHIGNIKLGPINFYHRYAEISYFIGDKQFWGRGITAKAIGEIVKIAKKKKLKKLIAGFYSLNVGSKKVLEKNGFRKEALFKSKFKFKNTRCDHVIYGKLI